MSTLDGGAATPAVANLPPPPPPAPLAHPQLPSQPHSLPMNLPMSATHTPPLTVPGGGSGSGFGPPALAPTIPEELAVDDLIKMHIDSSQLAQVIGKMMRTLSSQSHCLESLDAELRAQRRESEEQQAILRQAFTEQLQEQDKNHNAELGSLAAKFDLEIDRMANEIGEANRRLGEEEKVREAEMFQSRNELGTLREEMGQEFNTLLKNQQMDYDSRIRDLTERTTNDVRALSTDVNRLVQESAMHAGQMGAQQEEIANLRLQWEHEHQKLVAANTHNEKCVQKSYEELEELYNVFGLIKATAAEANRTGSQQDALLQTPIFRLLEGRLGELHSHGTEANRHLTTLDARLSEVFEKAKQFAEKDEVAQTVLELAERFKRDIHYLSTKLTETGQASTQTREECSNEVYTLRKELELVHTQREEMAESLSKKADLARVIELSTSIAVVPVLQEKFVESSQNFEAVYHRMSALEKDLHQVQLQQQHAGAAAGTGAAPTTPGMPGSFGRQLFSPDANHPGAPLDVPPTAPTHPNGPALTSPSKPRDKSPPRHTTPTSSFAAARQHTPSGIYSPLGRQTSPALTGANRLAGGGQQHLLGSYSTTTLAQRGAGALAGGSPLWNNTHQTQ